MQNTWTCFNNKLLLNTILLNTMIYSITFVKLCSCELKLMLPIIVPKRSKFHSHSCILFNLYRNNLRGKFTDNTFCDYINICLSNNYLQSTNVNWTVIFAISLNFIAHKLDEIFIASRLMRILTVLINCCRKLVSQ